MRRKLIEFTRDALKERVICEETFVDMLQLGSSAVSSGIKNGIRLVLANDRGLIIQPRGCGRCYVRMFRAMVKVRYIYNRYCKANCIQLIFHLAGDRAHQTSCEVNHPQLSLDAALPQNVEG